LHGHGLIIAFLLPEPEEEQCTEYQDPRPVARKDDVNIISKKILDNFTSRQQTGIIYVYQIRGG
jgi:hypothetical protein